MVWRRACSAAWWTSIALWVLALEILATPAVFGAGQFILSNIRVEPNPVEAYNRVTFRMNFSGAQAPVGRLWLRVARNGRQADWVPIEIGPAPAVAPAGWLASWWELEEAGSYHVSMVAEDTRGQRSAPLQLPFSVLEPSPRYEEMAYLSDGLRIKAYLYRPPRPGVSPAIIYSHGSRTRAELPEPGRYAWLAYRLARLGYLTLVAERRGYGGSDGIGVVGGEGGGLNNLRAGLVGEVRDVVAAIAFLKGRSDVDGTRIALVGKSLGGLVSLAAAAEDPGVRGVASLAGGYGFSSRMMSPEMLFVQDTIRTSAQRIKASTLLLHAQNDRIIPSELSRFVHQELEQRGIPSSLKVYPPFGLGGREVEGHTLFDGVDGFPYFWQDVTDFLAGVLRP